MNGVHLEAREQGLVVTDGAHSTRLETLAGDLKREQVEGRLAEPLARTLRAVLEAEARSGSRATWEGLVADRVAPELRRSGSWAEVLSACRRRSDPTEELEPVLLEYRDLY